MSSQHRKYWSNYSLSGIEIKARPFDSKNFPTGPANLPAYFWNDSQEAGTAPTTHRGYSEARSLIGSGTISDIENLTTQAVRIITQVFCSNGSELATSEAGSVPQPCLAKLKLSSNLEAWKNTQRGLGNILPSKKFGLTKAPSEVLDLLKATDWPEAMVTKNTLFSCGLANLLIGAADAPTLFSNYVTDMVGFRDHAFHLIFPSLAALSEKALSDPYALQTIGGYERRRAIRIGEEYITRKVELENRYKSSLAYCSAARLSRRQVQLVSFLDSSVVGYAAEAVSRGYDAAAAMTDLIICGLSNDVIDLGSDLLNSEVMNLFLGVADIIDTGIVSEHALRGIYDAYAAAAARMLTERWYEPTARMGANPYLWQMVNDRHMFLRRALLGWPKARKIAAHPQREADFDEVFDQHFRTTGFWRPLDRQYQCDGGDSCDRVEDFLVRNDQEQLLRDLWWFLVLGPLQYVKEGRIDESREEKLVEGCCIQITRVYTRGLVQEMVWLIAHANFHAWQVNYLLEAAMFGGILDGGELIGRLDRYENNV